MKKKCFKCKRVKLLEFFYKHPQMGDGHLNKCKTCTKRDVSTRYYEPEAHARIVEYEKKRFQDPERKKKVLAYQKNRRQRKPGKTRARRMVLNAIRSGKVVRLPCEVCGDTKSQAHHTDYRQPLNVKWLCFKHHREEHGQIVNQK